MSPLVTAIDPGYEQSAIVVITVGVAKPVQHVILPNEDVIAGLRAYPLHDNTLVIEQIEHYGMAVGKEVFETVYASGRFAEAWWPKRVERLPRRAVKIHLCHSAKATDANIRQALIDRFGPTREKAVGTRKTQGPLYGIKSHEWAALSLAVTFIDLHSAGAAVRTSGAVQ